MQEVAVAAHDLHQLEEDLTLAAAPGPAAPIRASPPHDSPTVQQQADHVAEATTAGEQPVGNHAFQQGSAGPAEAPASGQSEGSFALGQAPAPETQVQAAIHEGPASLISDTKRMEVEEKPAPAMGSMTPDKHPKSSQAGSPTTSTASDEPATLRDEEEHPRGGALQGKGSESRSSTTIDETEPRASSEGKAAPNSSSALSEANAEPSIHAAEGFTDNRAASDSPEDDARARAVPTAPMTMIKAKATPNCPAEELSAAESKPERQAAKSKAAAAVTSPPTAHAQSDVKSAPAPAPAAGSANVAAAASAISNPAAADAAAPGLSVLSSKADGNVVVLRHAVTKTDHADATATKAAAALLAVDPAAAKSAAALLAVKPAAAKPAAALPAADPAAAKPAAALLAVDPAAAKPAISKPTATEASSSAATASGGHATAAAPRPAQSGTEPKPVNGSSVGSSEGEYEMVAGAEYLEQLKDPKKRRLSSGATAVVSM